MDSQKQLDLGSWVGLQKAFANVASGCSAARVQCLKQVPDSHMLDDLGFTWEEFFTLHAERFGDAWFRLTKIARDDGATGTCAVPRNSPTQDDHEIGPVGIAFPMYMWPSAQTEIG